MELEKYYNYLKNERGMSDNSVLAYRADLEGFIKYLAEKGISDYERISSTEIVGYLLRLKNDGRSGTTSSRKLTSLRMYYGYLQEQGVINENPARGIKSPRIEKKPIDYLTMEEIDKIFNVVPQNEKDLRDIAIVELIYATGIRAGELIEMKLEDVNLNMNFIVCHGEYPRARVVPFGKPARTALEAYILGGRMRFARGEESIRELFLNRSGEKLTRQGLWKILGEYGENCGLTRKLTPQLLRNSFAVHMAENGASIKALQEMMGHEDLTATQAYLAATKSKIKAVYDKSHPRR